MNEVQKVIDRLVTAAESERLRASFIEDLEDEPFSRFDEWADSLREVADAISKARDAIEEWRDSESREEKAETKERALDAIEDLTNVWQSSPLDLSILVDWEAPE